VSNLEPEPRETECGGAVALASRPEAVLLPGRDVPLGRYTTVRRLLPHRDRRMVGAWCFLDHFGPDDVADRPGLQVPPHPHTGLQTVTWLMDGAVVHRDSLRSLQTIEPGQLNLMTSGRGIAHAETSPERRFGGPPTLHGLQLWVALPDGSREVAPGFEHHAELPVLREGGLSATVVVGELAGARSPATAHTPLVGADVVVTATGALPLRRAFEYGAVVTHGVVEVDGVPLEPGSLLYLGSGRSTLTLSSVDGGRLFLLGGEPFEERLVMWWNFVGRSHEDIVAARDDWEAARVSPDGNERFGAVHGYDGDPLPAPALPTSRLLPRDRHGHGSTS
jgi:redox-sensitive bicupin YhaK (pirin superfamily)